MKIKILLISTMLFFTSINAGELKMPAAFESKFVQEIVSPSKKKIIYTGKVQYSKSSLLKWQYVSPTKKEVCTDGKDLVIVDHDLEQISLYAINKGFNLPAVLTSAKRQTNGNYLAVYEKKNYYISLDSKMELTGISYNDDLDNKVSIRFNDMRYLNTPFSRNSMKCLLPQTYDLIRG
ncbi:MAG: LolA-like outer membrane lipoprotein chaperone [Sulfurovaceae bacterium]|nr:LolA-like outer membrane lipoprotein chaperone [Sulfurovaceae bacterium]